jgi:hypothetical protein
MSLPQEIVQTIETFAFEAPLTSLVRRVAERQDQNTHELTMTFRLEEFRDPELACSQDEFEEFQDDLEPGQLDHAVDITAGVVYRDNGMQYIDLVNGDGQDFCSTPIPDYGINAHAPLEHWVGEALKEVLIDPVKSLQAQLGPTRFAVKQALSGLGLGVSSMQGEPDNESADGVLTGLDEKTTVLLIPLVECAIEQLIKERRLIVDTWEQDVASQGWPFTISTIQEAARMAPEQVYERIMLGLQRDGLMVSNGKFQTPMAFFKAMGYLGVKEWRLSCLHGNIGYIATHEAIRRQRRDAVDQAAVIARLEADREQLTQEAKRLRNEVIINRVTIGDLHTCMKDLTSSLRFQIETVSRRDEALSQREKDTANLMETHQKAMGMLHGSLDTNKYYDGLLTKKDNVLAENEATIARMTKMLADAGIKFE